MKDDLPPGVIPVTQEMLDPNGPFATAIRKNVAQAEDAPSVREGDGWAGMLEGFCPVQGYGHVDTFNWYFRARHESWSFETYSAPFGPHGELPEEEAIVWETRADYGTETFDASWMPFSDAWRFIEESIAAFRTWRSEQTSEETKGDGR